MYAQMRNSGKQTKRIAKHELFPLRETVKQTRSTIFAKSKHPRYGSALATPEPQLSRIRANL